MNIPHEKPIKFAEKIISVKDKIAKVKCLFPSTPSLAMYFEAAAQSSAAFAKEQVQSQVGFIVSVKDIQLLEENDNLEVLVEVERKIEFGNICEFSFNILSIDETKSFAKGTFTIMLQE